MAPVAIVLHSSASATFPPASLSAMIPEPTTAASRKAVPSHSATARCARPGIIRCRVPAATRSPSSLTNSPCCAGSRSSTSSDGRQSLTPFGVTTIGRLIRIGCAIMASSKLVVGQGRVVEPELGIGRALLAQQRTQRKAHARDQAAASSARDGGVLRYSITCGSMPALRIMASVLREVPQAGLW